MNVAIETERLILREMGPDDIEFMAHLLADPDVMRFWPRPHTREESMGWIERQQWRYGEHGHGYWLAIEKETGLPVGQSGVLRGEVDGRMKENIGYIFDKPLWGRGFATEAARAGRQYIYDRLAPARATILVRPENTPSIRVAQRLGMVIEKTVMYADLLHHVFVDSNGTASIAPKSAS